MPPKRDFDNPKWEAARKSCYKRDGFKCVVCGSTKRLNAHHIIPYAQRPELEFVISNLITLCEEDHDRVTGKEHIFADDFRRIVKTNEEKAAANKGIYPRKIRSLFNKKYVPRNPRQRY